MDGLNDEAVIATVTAGQLRAFVERIERLEEDRRAVSVEIREVYDEAKSSGYDVKTLRRVVAIRRKKPEERSEEEAMLDLYLSALGVAR